MWPAGEAGRSAAEIRSIKAQHLLRHALHDTGNNAARLIEAAGMKGYSIGGAQVSEKHANFIVNTGNASASDIEALIEQVRDEVQRTSGVRLHAEVHRVGEAV